MRLGSLGDGGRSKSPQKTFCRDQSCLLCAVGQVMGLGGNSKPGGVSDVHNISTTCSKAFAFDGIVTSYKVSTE